MKAGMMIETHKQRPYIENLRKDPRTRALMESWVVQAMMASENSGKPRDEHEAMSFAHAVAKDAVALAMAFVLDNDGEYQTICRERDRYRDAHLQFAMITPTSLVMPS